MNTSFLKDFYATTKNTQTRTSQIKLLIPLRGRTPYNGLYSEVVPERGNFFRLQVYERVGISQDEVHERVGHRLDT